VLKPSQAPQFGAILRAPIQWVKKASKRWWIQFPSRKRTGNYCIRGHKRVYRYQCGETSYKPTSGESARFHLSDYRLVARHKLPGCPSSRRKRKNKIG
jgi:hypothetical protein